MTHLHLALELGIPAILIAVIAATIRLDLLPSFALALFVLVPFNNVSQLFGRYLAPSVLALAVWAIRLRFEPTREPGAGRVARTLAAASVLGLLGSLATGSHAPKALAWTSVALICLVAVPLVAPRADPRTWRALAVTFCALTVLVGGLAVIEVWTGFNPWRPTFTAATIDRHWTVPRAKGPFGHPLGTSLVLATGCVVALYERGLESPVRALAVLLGLAGVVATVSRSGLLAIGAAALLAVVLSGARPRSERARARWLAVGVAVAIAGIYLSPVLQHRVHSATGQQSLANRTTTITQAIDLAVSGLPLGTGPGSSPEVFTARHPGVTLENSALELAISLGLAAVPLYLIIGRGVLRGARGRGRAAALGLAASVVALSSYNIVDVSPMYLILPSVLLIGVGCTADRAPS